MYCFIVNLMRMNDVIILDIKQDDSITMEHLGMVSQAIMGLSIRNTQSHASLIDHVSSL